MKFLAMHITNQKLSFDIFTVGNIFMEHVGYFYKYTCAAYDCFCAPGTHKQIELDCINSSAFVVVLLHKIKM